MTTTLGLAATGALTSAEADPAGGHWLRGWVLPDPAEPETPPEIGLHVTGLGIRVVIADLQPHPEQGAPAGARAFAWRLPPQPGGGRVTVQAFDIGAGAELGGSPLALSSSAAGAGPPSHPASALGQWPAGLAGHVGAAGLVEVAEGLWATAQSPALSLRFQLLAGEATLCAPPPRGIRLLADKRSPRIELHLRPATPWPAAGRPARFQLRAWLPEATEPVTQAHFEVWLARRTEEGFEGLRRLRRTRIFRRASDIAFEMVLAEQEQAIAEALWITLVVRDATGLSSMAPTITDLAEVEAASASLEDWRLQGSFDLLRELVHLQGGMDPQHPILPDPLRATARPLPAAATAEGHLFTQIIIPVYNGDQIVQDCIRAVRESTTGPCQILVVDDGSRGFTAELLREEAGADPRIALHRRDINRGYTKSINEAVMMTTAEWVVILNSDTLVSPGWLDRLHAAARARPGTGLVGPLSNAATWQSIPDAKRPDASWSTNDMIAPGDRGRVQALLDAVSERAYPEFPVLNGFCTLIARPVFDTVGMFDEDAFPMGYGEETDLCLRARRAGFRLTVADDCFVYHHKSVSFGSATRSKLTRAGGLELRNKHLGITLATLEQGMQACPPMARLRARMSDLLRGLE